MHTYTCSEVSTFMTVKHVSHARGSAASSPEGPQFHSGVASGRGGAYSTAASPAAQQPPGTTVEPGSGKETSVDPGTGKPKPDWKALRKQHEENKKWSADYNEKAREDAKLAMLRQGGTVVKCQR
jgi:hypothetical protein